MRELSLKEVRNIQLSILKEVVGFCDEHDIIYSLCAGTLLGAVRHQGYIPWDDDIDIMLPRPNYEKLMETFQSERLILYNNSTDGYNKGYAKIADKNTHEVAPTPRKYKKGVDIDVFPIDGFPNSSILASFHLKKIALYMDLINGKYFNLNKHEPKPFIRILKLLILKTIASFFSRKHILKIVIKEIKKYPFESSDYRGIVGTQYKKREMCPKSVFEEVTDVLFEGHYFKGWKDYDTYLSNVYGDYMKLPPVEKRETHDLKYYTD
jgi:lipopolysaccharide cholinephosphotransferase